MCVCIYTNTKCLGRRYRDCLLKCEELRESYCNFMKVRLEGVLQCDRYKQSSNPRSKTGVKGLEVINGHGANNSVTRPVMTFY